LGGFRKFFRYFGRHFKRAPAVTAAHALSLAPIASRAQHAAFIV